MNSNRQIFQLYYREGIFEHLSPDGARVALGGVVVAGRGALTGHLSFCPARKFSHDRTAAAEEKRNEKG